MSRFLAKLAFAELTRRKGQAVLIVFGLMISTAVITGSLVVGDSTEYLVTKSTYDNLGEIDLVVSGSGFFDYELYNSIAVNSTLDKHIDKHAPMLFLPVGVESLNSNLRESDVQLFGYDNNFHDFGSFHHKYEGGKLTRAEVALEKNEVIINEYLAKKLNLGVTDHVRIFLNNPGFTMDSVYSSGEGSNALSRTLEVKHIVKNEGLGRLQLDGRTLDSANIFMNLSSLQEILDVDNNINMIFISNQGDAWSGLEHEDSASKAIGRCLDAKIGYSELGFEFNYTDLNYLSLTHDDLFFDEDVFELTEKYRGEADPDFLMSPVLTYFVNSITIPRNNKKVIYSMVSGLDLTRDNDFGEFEIKNSSAVTLNLDLAIDDIILVDWAAQRLEAKIGDTVTLEYMVLDRYNNIYNTSHDFTLKYIIALTGKAHDPALMPAFPGLEGSANCGDWKPPFPLDTSRLTQEDNEYWQAYKGSPKAYISLAQAQSLWSTNLGPYSMLKLNTSSDAISLQTLAAHLGARLDADLDHSNAGLSIEHVKSDALASSLGMSIFPMMFLTFSSVIILAGIALIVIMFLILGDSRKNELGITRAIGLRRSQVIKLFMFEGLYYALFAGVLGLVFGLFLGWGLISALNSIWSSAVQDYTIPFYFKPISLLIGFITGFIITIITIYITARHISKVGIISAIHDLPDSERSKRKSLITVGGLFVFIGIILLILSLSGYLENIANIDHFTYLFSPVLLLFGTGFIIGHKISKPTSKRNLVSVMGLIAVVYIISYAFWVFSVPGSPAVELFFSVGLLLVLSIIILLVMNLNLISRGLLRLSGLAGAGNKAIPVASYSLQNLNRNTFRTGQIITIFTLVIFLLVALSINIAVQDASVNAITTEQRGGYDIIGETAVPISIDLENSTQREKYNLMAPVLDELTVTEILLVGPPGGTCSNMNVRYPPRLLGVNHEFVTENEFSFMEPRVGSDDPGKLWRKLETGPDGNDDAIPIFVDYNTLVWIYEGELGKIYTIEDETGAEVKLEVIGVLENSVFGGTFIMSEGNLESLFPSRAEYKYLLFKLKPGVKTSKHTLVEQLERQLHQYGLDAEVITDVIQENNAYERSFMGLFQAFLGLGLVVGILGLGAVTARTVHERKYELGVLRALGYTRRMVVKAFLLEPFVIGTLAIIFGTLIGIISSYLAFGAWTGGNFEFVLPWFDLLFMIVVLYLVIFISASYPAYRASKLSPAETLRKAI